MIETKINHVKSSSLSNNFIVNSNAIDKSKSTNKGLLYKKLENISNTNNSISDFFSDRKFPINSCCLNYLTLKISLLEKKFNHLTEYEEIKVSVLSQSILKDFLDEIGLFKNSSKQNIKTTNVNLCEPINLHKVSKTKPINRKIISFTKTPTAEVKQLINSPYNLDLKAIVFNNESIGAGGQLSSNLSINNFNKNKTRNIGTLFSTLTNKTLTPNNHSNTNINSSVKFSNDYYNTFNSNKKKNPNVSKTGINNSIHDKVKNKSSSITIINNSNVKFTTLNLNLDKFYINERLNNNPSCLSDKNVVSSVKACDKKVNISNKESKIFKIFINSFKENRKTSFEAKKDLVQTAKENRKETTEPQTKYSTVEVNKEVGDFNFGNLMKFSYNKFLEESTTKSSKSDLNDIINN